jgi:[acyl-carrier-protein] S-malonyltransferase
MRRCYFYPGQGAQYPGMGKDLYEASAAVRRLFDLASDSTGLDCRRVLFESSEEELKPTNIAQMAIALVNRASAAVLSEEGIQSQGCAGFSLGEYSALNDAGVIRDEDLFRVIRIRGELMERAARGKDTPAGPTGMAAVMGLGIGEVEAVLAKVRAESPLLAVYPGLHNAQSQTVISGTAEALARAEALLGEAGAMKYVVLKTSGPFHSPLMEEARQALAAALEAFRFADPVKTLYSNVTGREVTSGVEAKRLCAEQVISTVRWVDVEQSVLADGYDEHLEVGPGSVLAGLWKRLQKGLKCRPAGKLAEIHAVKENAGNG